MVLAALWPCLSACSSSPELERFSHTLAVQTSATAALGQWCRENGIADPPKIIAERIKGDDLMPSLQIQRLLHAGPDEKIGYRHVRLICGREVLSVAHNWYIASRLTPAMNQVLETTDSPFGTVAAPLHFTRQRIAEKHGSLQGCPRGTILSHRALLSLPSGQPLSALVECYTAANLNR